MCILLLRALLVKDGEAAIEGRRESAALSLSYALAKKPSWLIDMFGRTPSGQPNVDRIFKRTAECTGEGYARVSLNSKNLLSRDIHVEREGRQCTAEKALSHLLKQLEDEAGAGEVVLRTPPPVHSLALALVSPTYHSRLLVPLSRIEHHLTYHLSQRTSLPSSLCGVHQSSTSHILRSNNPSPTTIDLELISVCSGSLEWRHTFSIEELHSLEGEGRCTAMILALLGVSGGDNVPLSAHAAYLRARRLASRHDESSVLSADALLRRALSLSPSFPQAEAYLAKIMQQRYTYGWDADDGTFDEAADSTRRALFSSSGTAHLASEHLAYLKGRPEEALLLSHQALLNSPLDPDLRTAYSKSLLNVGLGELAYTLTIELYRENPSDPQLMRALLRSALASGRVTEGLDLSLSYLSSSSGGVSDLLKYVACGASVIQDPALVIPYIEKQLAIDGKNVRLLLLLGRIAALRNDQKKAAEVWREGEALINQVASIEGNSELRSVRGLLRALTGDKRGAVQDASRVLERNPENGRLHFRLALIFAALNQRGRASRLLNSSRRLGFLAPYQIQIEESLGSFGSFIHAEEYRRYRQQVESYRGALLSLAPSMASMSS